MAKPGGESGRVEVFDERERAFEAKYRHDEEIEFKIGARTAHLFGLWAAERLGLAGAAAEDYARAIRDADLAQPRHLELLHKVAADLAAHGKTMTEEALRAQLESLRAEARKLIADELGSGRQKLEPGL